MPVTYQRCKRLFAYRWRGWRSIEVQKKTLLKYSAPLCNLAGIYFTGLAHSINEDYFGIPFGIGLNLIGAGFYVSRADHMPPRKNVFSRASDKIKEWAKSREGQPSGVPAPAYSQITLEERIA